MFNRSNEDSLPTWEIRNLNNADLSGLSETKKVT